MSMRSLAPTLPRRLHAERERMHRAGEFLGERLVYGTLARDPRLPGEGVGDKPDAEMGLALRARADMARVQVRFVDDLERRRAKSLRQLDTHGLGDGHEKGILRD